MLQIFLYKKDYIAKYVCVCVCVCVCVYIYVCIYIYILVLPGIFCINEIIFSNMHRVSYGGHLVT
jgi:hypothetical protein